MSSVPLVFARLQLRLLAAREGQIVSDDYFSPNQFFDMLGDRLRHTTASYHESQFYALLQGEAGQAGAASPTTAGSWVARFRNALALA